MRHDKGLRTRRALLRAAGAAALLAPLPAVACGGERRVLTLYTFGDSILDCGSYNEHGVHPGALLVRNDDRLFPEFRGQELAGARLEHRARDGATVSGLPAQADGITRTEDAVAILTIGGNDLLGGLVTDPGPGIEAFGRALERFLEALPIRPIVIGNVYDPSFGDDRRNFIGVEPAVARRAHGAVNDRLERAAARYGALADLHAHFLTGDESWFTHTIEPSLRGASEVRRVFLDAIRGLAG